MLDLRRLKVRSYWQMVDQQRASPLSNLGSLLTRLCTSHALLFELVGNALSAQTGPPSTPIANSLYSSLSTSYSTSTNWQGNDLRNFAFIGNVLYKHSAQDSTRSRAHQVLADLGYLKFVDSLWL